MIVQCFGCKFNFNKTIMLQFDRKDYCKGCFLEKIRKTQPWALFKVYSCDLKEEQLKNE